MTQSRAKGTRLERAVKRRLEEKGYVVIRSAGSHGPFDLVALKSRTPDNGTTMGGLGESDEVLSVQVKANRKPTRVQSRPCPTSVSLAKSGSMEMESMRGTSMNPRRWGLSFYVMNRTLDHLRG